MTGFPKTQWSLIDLAFREAPTGSREHMSQLLQKYWQPMYSHLRYKGVQHQQAEDLVQEFSMQILDGDLLQIADSRRGKFRTLLLTALDRFAVSRHRYDNAAKRSADGVVSLNSLQEQNAPADVEHPSAVFDRAWALDVLAHALATVKRECEEGGNLNRWIVFERRIVSPLLEGTAVPEYATLTRELNLENDKAVMNLLVTAKRQFSRTIREQIRQYVLSSDNSEQHIQKLSEQLQEENTSNEGADKLARHLSEQMIAECVNEELQHLRDVLANTCGLVEVQVDMDHASDSGEPEFLSRLSQEDVSPELASLYDCTDDKMLDVPIEIHFQTVLQIPVQEFDERFQQTIGEQILTDSPDEQALEAIKDWANRQRTSRIQTIPRDFATAIYYGTIAAALAGKGKRISGLGKFALTSGFEWLREQEWVDIKIREIANRAVATIEQK